MTHKRGVFWCAGLFVALILYGTTVCPGVSWGDSGEAQLHTLADGWVVADQICRSHVTYYALARAVTWLTHVSPALAANLVAVLFGALTVANVAWLMATFCRSTIAVIAGVLLMLLSHTLWQMSTAAEVVTLSTALLTAELICIVRFCETRRAAYLVGALFCNGLGVATHNMAMLMWPAYGLVAAAYWNKRRELGTKTAIAALVGLFVGLTPLLALCVDHYLTHGSTEAMLKSALVGRYEGQVLNLTDLLGLSARSVGYVVMNFPTPVLFLAIPGFVVWSRRTQPAPRLLITTAAVIFALFAVRYNVPDQFTFLVHTYVFVAIFCAAGVDWLLGGTGGLPASERHGQTSCQGAQWHPLDWLLARLRGRAATVAVVALCSSSPLVYLAVPTLLRNHAPELALLSPRSLPYRDRYDWFVKPWRTGYDGAERYARETLEALPQGALLCADSTAFPPIVYLQAARSLRRDVRLDERAPWQTWLLPPQDVDAMRRRHREAGTLFTSSDVPRYVPKWLRGTPSRFQPVGHVFRVIADP